MLLRNPLLESGLNLLLRRLLKAHRVYGLERLPADVRIQIQIPAQYVDGQRIG